MNILEINNVSKYYHKHIALDNLTVAIPKGSVFGLLGPNGAGKTSLIRTITQITKPDTGEIIFNGEKLSPKHISEIGYLPEERGLYKKMKVGEQLLYFAQLKGLSKVEALEKIKAWMIKFSIESWWDKNVEELSKGMQQKIQFISTVLHEPKLIILDEPFSGFDPVNANLIKDEILELRDKGSTIIFSTHRMESVEEICDEICMINKSQKVLEGPVNDIKLKFKENVFSILGKGNLEELKATFETRVIAESENQFEVEIKLSDSQKSNDILQFLISNNFEVLSFSEKLPSINDVFIKLAGSSDE